VNGVTGTFFDALCAVSALVFGFVYFKKAGVLKNPGDKPCRTKELAKRPVVKKACHNND